MKESARLKDLYANDLRGKLKEELALKNIMEVPRLSKIVLNIGVKGAVVDSKVLNVAQTVLSNIAGQAAVKTKSKKAIAGFKLRENMPIGVMVTLRGKRMYEFLDKLINLSLPGVRDFRGVGIKFDRTGNYNLGVKDWFIFSEVDYDKVDKSFGMNISIQTTAKDDRMARALLSSFNMPFSKE